MGSAETSGIALLLEEQRITNELLRALLRPQLRAEVEGLLASAAEWRGFEASDDSRGVRAVANEAGVSVAAVGKWWKKWRAAGAATEDDRGRVRHVMSLAALGISIEGQ